MANPSTYELVDLKALPGIPCPCGEARRAFADRGDFPATVHLTSISKDAQLHYHRQQTEVYVVVKCEENAAIELDGQIHPLHPGMAVLIPPGVHHRAIGEMEVILFCTPKFDPNDEFFLPSES
ncbi:Cupin domain protein [Roseimaritima multifibrata]|uniref:Cupin domain protein n=1 Tax=Roseimaritima multifibrata TaxID=1930274 RepID=A0A517MPK6_9BACT|nr:cupin domain-containing protein [Roseimaritima multifibrata]QDS96717.1 Cupin domain protein [Roseimaritima multifibrata]